MFVFGSGKRYLAKNPSHTPRIRSLLMYFPDAKFIYMLRNPLDTIASTINMYRNYKKILDSAVSMEKIRSQTLKFADIYYNYPLLKCKDLYGKSLFICRFDEITKEPSAAIERICRLTGAEYTVPTSGPLNDKDTVAAKHKATDRYLPEDFGLDNVMIKERYSQIYREYLI